MVNPNHRILVLGHSFVWRLEKFIKEAQFNCLDQHFAVADNVLVRFHGIGGRTVDSLRNFDLPVITSFQPTLVILEIGSNDLCNPRSAVPIIAANILQLLQLLHYAFNVRHIIVNQVCKRNSNNRSHLSYNTRVFQLNYLLLQIIKQLPFATFWFHRRVTRSVLPMLLPDGVHLNSEGNHLLYHSYHDAIAYYILNLAHRPSNCHRFVSFRPSWSRHRRYAPY